MSRNPDKIFATSYLTSHQAANLIQVNPSSINKWVKEGKITCFKTPGGHRRIRADVFVQFLTRYEMPIPDALHFAKPIIIMAAKPTKKSIRKSPKKK